MKKTFYPLLLVALIFPSLCCGKKGPIYPPLANIPKPIEEFHAIQRGTHVILSWNNPTAYIDGNPIEEITRVEIWLLIESDDAAKDKAVAQEKAEEEGQEQVEKDLSEPKAEAATSLAENFPENATLLASIAKDRFSEYSNQTQEENLEGGFVYIHPLSSDDFTGKTYTFGLKAWAKKKESGFSTLLSIKPKPLPFPPTDLKAEVLEDKIQIEWTSPGKNIDDSSPAEVMGYTVYKRSKDIGMHRVGTGLIKDTKFFDSEFQFGETYTYYIRASASESSPFLESDNSEPLEVIPKDTFPPKPPKGLVAIAGDDFVSLSWDINRELDLAGYRIWRKSGDDKDYSALGELVRENVYNDTSVKTENGYEYAITAVDKSGNESQKSKSILVTPGRGLR